MSWSHLHRMAANTLIMGQCRSRALGLYMMQHPKALTLCWHSVDTVFMLCWRSVDALLTRCWRSVDTHFEVQWYQHIRYCLSRLPIHRLCINAVAQPLEYTRCNTQNRWRSVDAHCQSGAVTMSRSLLFRIAATTMIMDICRTTALGLYKMQYPKSLTLCWHSVDALLMLYWRSVDTLLTLCWRSFGGVAVSTHTILPVKAANTLIIDKCRSTAFGLYKMQPTKSLTLCWRSFLDWGSDHVAIAFAQNGCQYVDYGYMP